MMASVRSDHPVADVASGSDRFEDFYRVASVEVYRTLTVVLRDSDLAQEAMDEAMMRAFEHWRKVRTYGNPAGWVYRVALNWARSRLRRRKREVLGDPSPRSYVDPMPDPELDEAVAGLPLHHREVIVCRFLLDMTQEQIAALLRIPVGTVKSRLHRALGALREQVE